MANGKDKEVVAGTALVGEAEGPPPLVKTEHNGYLNQKHLLEVITELDKRVKALEAQLAEPEPQ